MNAQLAKEISELALNRKTTAAELRAFIDGPASERVENKFELMVVLGYAVHYADDATKSYGVTRLFQAMGVDGQSEKSRKVTLNADNCVISRVRPCVGSMLNASIEHEDDAALFRDIMTSVYYAKTEQEQSLILRMIEQHFSSLLAAPSQAVIDKSSHSPLVDGSEVSPDMIMRR